jgi:secondary thiamine-phosphate synthase enzyme
MTTRNEKEIVNITTEVAAIVEKSGVKEGMALVSAMHITAAIFVNDEEPGIKRDFLEWAEKLAPFNLNYHHHQTGETNGDAHLKSILFHHEVIVPVTKGKLDFGPWQQIFYGEFDGKRRKRVLVKIIGE